MADVSDTDISTGEFRFYMLRYVPSVDDGPSIRCSVRGGSFEQDRDQLALD